MAPKDGLRTESPLQFERLPPVSNDFENDNDDED
jgi:hypothetical protein